jgi:hypothetical protein
MSTTGDLAAIVGVVSFPTSKGIQGEIGQEVEVEVEVENS